jgi:hypothetical protein
MNNERSLSIGDRNSIRASFRAPGEHGVALAEGWFRACCPRLRNETQPGPAKPTPNTDLVGWALSKDAESEASQAD